MCLLEVVVMKCTICMVYPDINLTKKKKKAKTWTIGCVRVILGPWILKIIAASCILGLYYRYRWVLDWLTNDFCNLYTVSRVCVLHWTSFFAGSSIKERLDY